MTLSPSALLAAGLVLATAGALWQAERIRRAVAVWRRPPRAGRATWHSRSTPGLQGLVGRWWREAVIDADIPWAAERVTATWLLCGLSAAGAGWMAGGPALAALGTGVAVVGPLAVLRASSGRRVHRLAAALPDALDQTARGLRSGGSVPEALAEVAAKAPAGLAAELWPVVDATRAGVPLDSALDGWVRHPSLPGLRLAAAAIGLSSVHGGSRARAVDRVAGTLRDRLAIEREVQALSAQARMSAVVIAVAPLVFTGLAASVDASTAEFLLRTPGGLTCLAGGLALDGLAAWWMARITRAAT